MRLLTEPEFKKTMAGAMENVTATADAVVDIWSFVEALKDENIVLDYVFQHRLVEVVYRNAAKTFDHILLPTKNANGFVVIVVSLPTQSIHGYFPLNLNQLYSQKL